MRERLVEFSHWSLRASIEIFTPMGRKKEEVPKERKDTKANQRGTRPAAGQTDRLRGIREELFILSEPNRLNLSAFSI